MKITNIHNLPTPIVEAVNKTYPPKPDRFSVTDLIGPALIRRLRISCWDQLEEDASARLWMLLGSAVHYIIDGHTDPNSFTEEKLEAKVDGAVIVGKSDNYKDGVITDYKVTSVWSYLLGDHKDWETQLNCYAWLWGRNGFQAKKLLVNAILRDWQKSKLTDPKYPRIQFVSVGLRLWSPKEQQEYIEDQLHYHRMADAPECTPEEKWEKPTTYAIMKKGRKSALRVLEGQFEAEQWCVEHDHAQVDDTIEGIDVRLATNISIVERPGECIRCKDYCPVNKVCPHANGIQR